MMLSNNSAPALALLFVTIACTIAFTVNAWKLGGEKYVYRTPVFRKLRNSIPIDGLFTVLYWFTMVPLFGERYWVNRLFVVLSGFAFAAGMVNFLGIEESLLETKSKHAKKGAFYFGIAALLVFFVFGHFT
ncbi:MAG: hypothetical protein ACTSU5_16030, partial [Promethearchaeota archaeon]